MTLHSSFRGRAFLQPARRLARQQAIPDCRRGHAHCPQRDFHRRCCRYAPGSLARSGHAIRPRIVVLLVGNGARETSLRGRPPSAHLALVRALCDVPNVALLRVHEAGTTKFTVNARFGDEPALELAHPFPGLPLVRGLRISARAGLVFNRDNMSAEAIGHVAMRHPGRIVDAIVAVQRRPAFQALLSEEARTKRDVWVAARPAPTTPPRTWEDPWMRPVVLSVQSNRRVGDWPPTSPSTAAACPAPPALASKRRNRG